MRSPAWSTRVGIGRAEESVGDVGDDGEKVSVVVESREQLLANFTHRLLPYRGRSPNGHLLSRKPGPADQAASPDASHALSLCLVPESYSSTLSPFGRFSDQRPLDIYSSLPEATVCFLEADAEAFGRQRQ